MKFKTAQYIFDRNHLLVLKFFALAKDIVGTDYLKAEYYYQQACRLMQDNKELSEIMRNSNT